MGHQFALYQAEISVIPHYIFTFGIPLLVKAIPGIRDSSGVE